jgi:hypothetical protein
MLLRSSLFSRAVEMFRFENITNVSLVVVAGLVETPSFKFSTAVI